MYKVVYKKSAAKSLAKMPVKIALKFTAGFDLIAQENDIELDIKKLENREGFRLRIGVYRALYRVFEDILTIEVVKIGSRGDVYK